MGEKTFDISSRNLHDLMWMRNHNWQLLEQINISRNMLNDISVLNKFSGLRVIQANNCYIEEVNLRLPKLEKLDLSNNVIKNFPILASMNKLNHLNLNSNKLVDMRQMKIEFTLGLTHFDLGNNIQMQFDSTPDFDQFLNKLKKIKLEYLTIDEECLKPHEGLSKLLLNLKTLKYINGGDKMAI